MDCPDIRVYLPFLDEGSLEPEIEAEVKLHLLLCKDCRAERDDGKNVIGLVHAAYPSRNTDSVINLTPAVWRGIARRKRERRFLQFSVPAAAAAVLIACSVFLFGQFRADAPSESQVSPVSDEYYAYLAEHYLNAEDAVSLTDNLAEESELLNVDTDFLLESGYVHVTMDRVFQHLDSSQIEEMFQMASY